ncbi:MAG: hypothetical protein IR527_02220 [Bacteroides sp.]|nr:MAG: hypothetical protein IR527_02220 [Bacteroides sp.]
MLFSFKILKKYIHINIDIYTLVNKLNTMGIESDVINNDTIDVYLNPDRYDMRSYLGIAKEINILLDNKIKYYNTFFEENLISNDHLLKIDITSNVICKQYLGIIVSDFSYYQSTPKWILNILNFHLIKPVNYIQDIANFILLETGQIINIYNIDEYINKKIQISLNENKFRNFIYKGQNFKLHEKDIIMHDDKNIISLSGFFQKNNFDCNTKNILLELAYYNDALISQTSNRLRICNKYQKIKYDKNIIDYTSNRILSLLRKEYKDINTFYVKNYKNSYYDNNNIINYDIKNYQFTIGQKIQKKIAIKIFKKLNFKILKENEGIFQLLIPSSRSDIKSDINITKELMRFNEIDNIYNSKLTNNINNISLNKKIAYFLSSNNFYEIITCPISSDKYANIFHDNVSNIVSISNSLSKEYNIMRYNMIISALKTIISNINKNNKDFLLYEIGKTYHLFNNKYVEKDKIALWGTGKIYFQQWEFYNVNFFTLKGILEAIFKKIGIEKYEVINFNYPYLDYGIKFIYDKYELGYLGKISNYIDSYLSNKQDIFYAEINYNVINNIIKNKVDYIPYSKYPIIKRDLSLIINKKINFKNICDIAYNLNTKNILKYLFIFDKYQDNSLGLNNESYSIRYIFQHNKRTLKDEEINIFMEILINEYKINNIIIRS